MQQLVSALRALPPDIDVHGPEPSVIAALTDAQLVTAVGGAIAGPKVKGSSFTLHAPMELLARATLLPLAPPNMRSAGRMRIAGIAALYAEGDEVDRPDVPSCPPEEAKAKLLAALRDHDSDGADAALMALAPQVPAQDLCAELTDLIAASLGAAAHAPILLAALPEAAPRYGDLALTVRTAIRGLAAARGHLTWVDGDKSAGGPKDLWEALAAPPRRDAPSSSIAPTMLAVEKNGLAASLLGEATGLPLEDARIALSRIAALSMLQDDPDHAPYGWSHCLTLPQGLLALAPYSKNPARLVRIAATYVLGFRSTLGKVRLEKDWRPVPVDVTALAANALVHEDAHLAKYTVACLRAAADDPPARPLFLAAAAHLAAWWERAGVPRGV